MSSAQSRAIEWAQYARACCTDTGRIGAFMSALNESEKILDLLLRELQLKTVADVLRFALDAPHADRSWMKRGQDAKTNPRNRAGGQVDPIRQVDG